MKILLFFLFSFSLFAQNKAVIGPLDWTDIASFEEDSLERKAALPVANLHIPAKGSRCTGFLVAPDVLMTNNHCIKSQEEAVGANADFLYLEENSSVDNYDCSTLLATDATNDYALLYCQGNPSRLYGQVTFGLEPVSAYDKVWVIQQNCDYPYHSDCAKTQKIAGGAITDIKSRGTEIEYAHSADTLWGSSGSPMFDQAFRVVGLHHLSSGTDRYGRGYYNMSRPITLVLKSALEKLPNLPLDIPHSFFEFLPVNAQNDSFERASNLAFKRQSFFTAALDQTSPVDYLKLSVSREKKLWIRAHHFEMEDLKITLFDEHKKQVTSSSLFYGETSITLPRGKFFLELRSLGRGRYYLY